MLGILFDWALFRSYETRTFFMMGLLFVRHCNFWIHLYFFDFDSAKIHTLVWLRNMAKKYCFAVASKVVCDDVNDQPLRLGFDPVMELQQPNLLGVQKLIDQIQFWSTPKGGSAVWKDILISRQSIPPSHHHIRNPSFPSSDRQQKQLCTTHPITGDKM